MSNAAPESSHPGQRAGRPGFLRFARQAAMAAISITTVLLVWHWSVGNLFNSALVPTPAATFTKAWGMMVSGELFMHIGVSLRRVLIGYVIGCACGIMLGAVMGRFWLARELADPILELIRPISPVAIVPLAMLWFGIGEMSKFFIIIYATLIIVLLNTAAGVSRAPVTRIRAHLSWLRSLPRRGNVSANALPDASRPARASARD